MDRKQSILEAATKSFTMFGYKATTMDQVAKIANVGKGTIYTFFKNKEELFDEIMASLINDMKEAAEETIDCSAPFFDNLNNVLNRMLDFRVSHELMIKLSQEIREMRTPAADEAMRKVETALLSFIKKEVQHAVDREEIRKCDPELTAFVMLKMYVALVSDWENNHDQLTREQIADLFRLYLMEGLSL